jgi:hypothetical protein
MLLFNSNFHAYDSKILFRSSTRTLYFVYFSTSIHINLSVKSLDQEINIHTGKCFSHLRVNTVHFHYKD